MRYIGARYVPLMMGDWDNTKSYEPLSVVTYQGNSYTSKKNVPTGINITDTNYWVRTGNYNQQVEQMYTEWNNFKDEMSQLSVTPEMYGAVGDGINDDTNAINRAIENGVVSFKHNATYLVKDINARNCVIHANGATLKTKISDTEIYCAMNIGNNVSIIGDLFIDGQRNLQTQPGEWGSGLTINGANIHINNVHVSNCKGDGIYIPYANGLTINLADIFNAYRNGVGVISCNNIMIDTLKANDINGVSPMAGIDFEPNNSSQNITNVFINNVIAMDVNHGVLFANNHDSEFDGIVINNITAKSNMDAVRFRRTAECTKKNTNNYINIGNIYVIECHESAFYIDNWADEYCPIVTVDNLSIEKFVAGTPLYSKNLIAMAYSLDKIGGITIRDVYYENINNALLFYVYRGQGINPIFNKLNIKYNGNWVSPFPLSVFTFNDSIISSPNAINNDEQSVIQSGWNIITTRTTIQLTNYINQATCISLSDTNFTVINETNTILIVNGVEQGDGTYDEYVALPNSAKKSVTITRLLDRYYINY